MVFNILLLLFGVLLASSAVIMIKACTLSPLLLAAGRLLLAGIFLLPLFFRDLKRSGNRFSLKLIVPSVIPGILLGIHFISWIFGARMAPAANSTLIVNLIPVVMPFYIYLLYREKITPVEIAGTVISMIGVTVLAASDFSFDKGTFAGDAVCFVSMLFYALYTALARRNARGRSLWIYIVPLYLIGGVFCLLVALPFVSPFTHYTGMDILMLLGLALVPTIVGHTVLNRSMMVLPAQTVSLINILQFVFAGVTAYLIFGEIPQVSFYIATFLVLGGAVTVILSQRRKSGGKNSANAR